MSGDEVANAIRILWAGVEGLVNPLSHHRANCERCTRGPQDLLEELFGRMDSETHASAKTSGRTEAIQMAQTKAYVAARTYDL